MEQKEEVSFRLKNMRSTLKPITARQYADFFEEAIPIFSDYEYQSMLSYNFHRSYLHFDYPKIYVALKLLFGESTTMYDDYKCSFGFTFLIILEDKDLKSRYVFNFTDLKGGLDFSFMKILEPHEKNNNFERNKLYTPEECGFPKDEMRYFMETFLIYLAWFMIPLEEEYDQEFARILYNERIIYGYRKGAFFFNCFEYEDEDQFYELRDSISEDSIPLNVTKPNY